VAGSRLYEALQYEQEHREQTALRNQQPQYTCDALEKRQEEVATILLQLLAGEEVVDAAQQWIDAPCQKGPVTV
jgi:hypothetical protein